MELTNSSPSSPCQACGSGFSSPKAENTCNFCNKTYCKSHIQKTRPNAKNPQILSAICEKCEKNMIFKGIFDDFSKEKECLEGEIAELTSKNMNFDEEILMKKEAFEGIKHEKDVFIEKLTNETLGLGQEIEFYSEKARISLKEYKEKLIEKEALDQENEGLVVLLKELLENPEEMSPTGYGYIYEDGLLKRKELNRKKCCENQWFFCC